MLWLLLICALQSAAADRMLLSEQTREGVEKVLAEAVAKGERRIEIVILPAGEARRTPFGEFAFGYGGQGHGDVSLPNPAFFQHLDWVLKRVQSRRLEAVVLPVDRGSNLVGRNDREKWFEWGRYLGRRYMKAKGLVWLKQDDAGPLLAVEEGIRQFDTIHRFESGR
ncbi:MAG: DUF4038 domain-containing protein [Acidobacteria bacterium]|nr:DUF4038 domain-containing protein [Acidobacteriota bacterium]